MKSRKIRVRTNQVDRLLADVGDLPSQPVGDHLSDDEFIGLAMETLPAQQVERIDTHLAACPDCAMEMERLLEAAEAWRGEPGKQRLAALRERLLGSLLTPKQPSVLERWTALLEVLDENVREVMEALGPPAATPEILDRLAARLQDPEWLVRGAAAEALGALGAPAATPPILDRLAALMEDPDWWVREAAAEAVGALGAAAATPEVLEHLAALLEDPDVNVRGAAARAVGALGAPAATPPILDCLAARLQDPDENVREVAAWAMRALEAAAATLKHPSLRERLRRYLQEAMTSWQEQFANRRPAWAAETGEAGRREIWSWQSEDGRLRGHAVLESSGQLTLRFVTEDLDLEGQRFVLRLGDRRREVVFQRVSETEVGARVVVPAHELPEDPTDISLEEIP